MNLDAIAIGKNPPDEVNVIIEVPIGGEPIKYELDKEAGILKVDRFLHTSMRYPGNYGFIPHTLSDDGDPCDVIVANTREIVPGAMMASPFGCTCTAEANIAFGLQMKWISTMTAMNVAPPSSRHALMICTQVVAFMPPNAT